MTRHPAMRALAPLLPARFLLLRPLPALLLLAPLVACSPLPSKRSDTDLYAPQPVISIDETWPQVRWQLAVTRPAAGPLIDSTRIAVRPQPDQLQVYKGAAWADQAPDLVQVALLRGFEESGRILAVDRPDGTLRADYVLDLDLRHFETIYTDAGSPQVRIEVQARLVSTRGSRVVGAQRFIAERAPADAEVPAVAAAFESALGELAGAIVGWTLVTGEANAQNIDRGR